MVKIIILTPVLAVTTAHMEVTPPLVISNKGGARGQGYQPTLLQLLQRVMPTSGMKER